LTSSPTLAASPCTPRRNGRSRGFDAARTNAELNDLENITFTRSNACDLLRGRSDAGEGSKARRAYKEINLRAMKLLDPGGTLVMCSCSYHFSRKLMEDTLRSAAADAGKTLRVREWRGQAQDHPEILTIPETCYLKCAVLECHGHAKIRTLGDALGAAAR
jgi:23S rRNA (cytosine1962-C5)-methyltransferase